MNRSRIFNFLILVFAIACGSANGQTEGARCSQAPISIAFLTKPGEGWDVQFAKGAAVLSKGPYMFSDGKNQRESGLVVSQYEVKKLIITLPHIEINPCDRTGTLTEFYLMPKQVRSFEKNGRLFAYQVWAQRMGGPETNSTVVGENLHVIFYDMHGDGIFDSVRIASGIGMPLVPEWVEKNSNP